MVATGIERISILASLGEALVEAVRESGLLKKKAGRKKGAVKRKYTKRVKVDTTPTVKVKKVKVTKPAPEPETEEDDSDED